MSGEARFCSNCRAELPHDASACPACGVYAGDVYDGKRPRKPTRFDLFLPLLILAIAGAGVAVWINRAQPAETPKPAPAAVIKPEPVANQAAAMRALRKTLSAQFSVKPDCIAMLAHHAPKGVYLLTAINRCNGMRYGRWRVDGKSGAIARAAAP